VVEVNSSLLSGRLTADPVLVVVAGKTTGEGRSVVTFDIAYDHPHDKRRPKPERRTCYRHIRAYGRTGEAAKKNLQKADVVMIVNGVSIQDLWIDNTTKKSRSKEFLEPPPMGLIYLEVKKYGAGKQKSVDG